MSVAAPTTLSFAPADSMTAQTVTLEAAQDDDSVGGRAQFVIASAVGARALEVIEVDDDAPPPEPDAGVVDGGTPDASVFADAGELADAGTLVDAAVFVDASGSEPTPDAGDAPGAPAGGCNCNAHGRGAGSGALWLVLVLGLVTRGARGRRGRGGCRRTSSRT